ncbi:MarR family winged helix-turn-helix transcriptional regulator [Roseomonas chloroacetimidivorans]|uniref:MarR family winged helix-turn-helix transcriptional regulator n=1 Tax=Roseomonas chloroacetimidivorans TaxID=1766656 RepID=UPI003C7089AD
MSSSAKVNGARLRRSAPEPLAVEPAIDLWSRPGYLIRRLHQLSVAVFLEEMADLNLTPLQLGALTVIANRPGLDQAAIAAELGTDRVTTGDVLNRLEKNDLAYRQVSARDKRYKEVYLTPSGLKLAKDGAARLSLIQNRFLKPLSQDQRKVFLGLVRELIKANERDSRMLRSTN